MTVDNPAKFIPRYNHSIKNPSELIPQKGRPIILCIGRNQEAILLPLSTRNTWALHRLIYLGQLGSTLCHANFSFSVKIFIPICLSFRLPPRSDPLTCRACGSLRSNAVYATPYIHRRQYLVTDWMLVDVYELERKEFPGRWARGVASMDDSHPHGLVYTRWAPTADGSVESIGTECVSKEIDEAIAKPVTVTQLAMARIIYTKRWFWLWLETVT